MGRRAEIADMPNAVTFRERKVISTRDVELIAELRREGITDRKTLRDALWHLTKLASEKIDALLDAECIE